MNRYDAEDASAVPICHERNNHERLLVVIGFCLVSREVPHRFCHGVQVVTSLHWRSLKPDASRGQRINCGTALGYLTTIIPALSLGRDHDPRCRMFDVAQGAVLCHISRRVSVFRSFVVVHLVQSISSQLRDLVQIASAISKRRTLPSIVQENIFHPLTHCFACH